MKNAIGRISLEDAMMVHNGLGAALDTEITDFKLSYWIGRLHDKTGSLKKHFDRAKTKLFKQFGEEDADGKITVPKEKEEAFTIALEELLAQEEEITLPRLRVSQFEKENLKPIFYRQVSPVLLDDLFEDAQEVEEIPNKSVRKKKTA